MAKKPKNDDHSHDEHRPNVKSYVLVFAALMALTLITVAISNLHLPRPQAIALGLAVAAVKAGLVGAIFMHLWGENKLVHKFLYVTGACALILIVGIIDARLLRPKLTGRVAVAEQHPDEGKAEAK